MSEISSHFKLCAATPRDMKRNMRNKTACIISLLGRQAFVVEIRL
jgi:hypothetical protein